MFRIAIHGGAGLSNQQDLGQEREAQARKALQRSLQEAHDILAKGGSALDAVEIAVCIMEDEEVFNAGRGSVFAADGVQRMDASIMDGGTKMAGALCGVSRIRNPIKTARAIMEHTPHVMLYGKDAEDLTEECGYELVDRSWFYSKYRWQQLQRALKANKIILDHESIDKGLSKGTVGAVALDQSGNLAAATSTGGLVNKRAGRVGDSALIGAGTYADNQSCAVSATGHGELFIRAYVAARMSALVELKGLSLQEAGHQLIFTELPPNAGGLIACDRHGNMTLPFSTGGMFRGYATEDNALRIGVWQNET